MANLDSSAVAEPGTSPAVALEEAVGAASRWQRLRDWIWGYDFFISYHWSSGGRYAAALANRLREPPEPCDVMLDAAEFTAGSDWRTQAAVALRNTQRLILIGTRQALEDSVPVAAEVAAFTRRSRLVIPVVFDEEIVRRPRTGHRVLGVIPEDAIFVVEDPICLSRGPSDEAVTAIKRTHRLLRRRSLRTRLLLAAILLVGGASAFCGWAGLVRWQSLQRSVAATTALLSRAEAALAADEPDVAETLITEAEHRLRDGATGALHDRAAACRADLERLRELLAIEDGSWAIVDGNLPAAAQTSGRHEDFFARHFGPLATTNPRDVADRVSGSSITDRLVATLDLLVARRAEQAAAAAAVLAELDHDPYRQRLRSALVTGAAEDVALLLDDAEVGVQGPRFLLAVASSPLPPVDTRRAILVDAWRRYPDDYGILMQLGTAYGRRWGDTGGDAAGLMARISYFRAAVAVRPRSVAAWNDLAAALARVGLATEARAAAETAGALDPTDPLPQVNAAVACCMLEDIDAAERHARKAVELGEKLASTHSILGTVLLDHRHDAVGAVAALRTAVALDPRVPMLQQTLGLALLAAGRQREAIDAFRAAAAVEPDAPDYWFVLGFEAFDVGDETTAQEAFLRGMAVLHNANDGPTLMRDVLGRIDSAKLAVILAATAVARSAPREALAIADKGVALRPDEPLLHYYRSEALLAIGDITDALGSCRTSVRLAPTFAPAWNNLGLALLAQDDLEEAATALGEAVRLDPTYARAHLNLGNCHMLQANVPAAIGSYEEAVRHDPDYVKGWLNLSVARHRAGDLDGASEAADRAAALAPDDEQVQRFRDGLESERSRGR